MSHKNLRILCDQDGVLTDLFPHALRWYNRAYGTAATMEDITSYDPSDYMPHGKFFSDLWKDPLFFSQLPIVKGAKEFVEEVQKRGHEFYIVTKASGHEDIASVKLRWIRRNLPSVDMDHVIIGTPKHLLSGDVFIDDCTNNHRAQLAADQCDYQLCPGYPYNKDCIKVFEESIYTSLNTYIPDYKDMPKVFEQMLEIIDFAATTYGYDEIDF